MKAPRNHLFWPATRVRRFVRLITDNPRWRGSYDQNIRILNATYNYFVGSTREDPTAFMMKVNPISFARMLGLEPCQIKVFLPDSWKELNHRLLHSKCEPCRMLAI